MSGSAKKQTKKYSLQKAPAPAVKAAQAADPIPEVKYPYIGSEMRRIFLLTGIIIILLVASYFILR